VEHGRIIRVTFQRGETAIYVVAQEDAAEAISILAQHIEPGAELEPIGRASLRLLQSLSLSPGEFRKTTA